jgi:hypothetical protein
MNEFEIWFLAIGGVPRPGQLMFVTGFGFSRRRCGKSNEAQPVFNILAISILFYDLSL